MWLKTPKSCWLQLLQGTLRILAAHRLCRQLQGYRPHGSSGTGSARRGEKHRCGATGQLGQRPLPLDTLQSGRRAGLGTEVVFGTRGESVVNRIGWEYLDEKSPGALSSQLWVKNFGFNFLP